MIILALDTASDQASVAVRVAGATLSEEAVTTTDGHSHLIFQMIQAALEKAGIGLAEVDCFATACGPGSFTGVRLCMTAMKGLAEAMGKPVIGISNLRALATFGTAELRRPMIDARRGQVYAAVYDSSLRLISEETLGKADDWKSEPQLESITITAPLASAIAYCAELDGPGKWHDPAFLDANYVRRSDAEMFWTDTRQPQKLNSPCLPR